MAPRKKTPAARAATPPPMGDTVALAARLRSGDPEAIEQAYRQTFTGDVGRFVLAHLMSEAGVGRRFGSALTGHELAYHQGGHDVALEIMERAGFDPAGAVLTVITGQLEGQTDELSAHAEADPVFD